MIYQYAYKGNYVEIHLLFNGSLPKTINICYAITCTIMLDLA